MSRAVNYRRQDSVTSPRTGLHSHSTAARRRHVGLRRPWHGSFPPPQNTASEFHIPPRPNQMRLLLRGENRIAHRHHPVVDIWKCQINRRIQLVLRQDMKPARRQQPEYIALEVR